MCVGGYVTCARSSEHRTSFSHCKALVLVEDGDTKTVGTLEHVVKERKISKIYNHKDLAAVGKIGASLERKKENVGYVPAEGDSMAAALKKAAGASNSVALIWTIKVAGDKIMPAGLSLVLTKQLLATPLIQTVP